MGLVAAAERRREWVMSVESQSEIVKELEPIECPVRQADPELEEGLRQIGAYISRGGRVDEARDRS
jgi:hypothetical protein